MAPRAPGLLSRTEACATWPPAPPDRPWPRSPTLPADGPRLRAARGPRSPAPPAWPPLQRQPPAPPPICPPPRSRCLPLFPSAAVVASVPFAAAAAKSRSSVTADQCHCHHHLGLLRIDYGVSPCHNIHLFAAMMQIKTVCNVILAFDDFSEAHMSLFNLTISLCC
ncbi:hypothetical protein BS78_02G095600 [Paspalum vaginatum]|nr:hypothetical protein BS78_02G095600 [Paspalum vaginatum]